MTNGDIAKKGDIINENGKILGKHDGTPFYTIGQRKGIGIASPFPLYVLGVDAKENKVIVGENEKLYKESIMCNNINIIGAEVLEELKGKELIVKCRSRDSYHRAVITKAEDDIIEAKFIDPVRAVTPGQVAVFYQEDGLVMASGFIEK